MELRWRIAALVLAVGGLSLALPAQAQFSTSYKFLEAVRKKEGKEVTDMLAVPGSTLVNTKDVSSGDTPLHIVVARRDLTWVQFLAAKGANVNARNNKGETPLQLASNLGFSEGVEILLKLGAKVDEPNATGETAPKPNAHAAIRHRNSTPTSCYAQPERGVVPLPICG